MLPSSRAAKPSCTAAAVFRNGFGFESVGRSRVSGGASCGLFHVKQSTADRGKPVFRLDTVAAAPLDRRASQSEFPLFSPLGDLPAKLNPPSHGRPSPHASTHHEAGRRSQARRGQRGKFINSFKYVVFVLRIIIDQTGTLCARFQARTEIARDPRAR